MRNRFVAIVATLCVGLVACGGDDDSSSTADSQDVESTGDASQGEADPNGVLRLGYDLVAQPTGGFSLNPAAGINANTTHMGVYHWIYGALMRPAPDGTLEPGLAKSATIVDKNTIEIVMRKGLTLSDGTPLNAKTVKAVLDRNLSRDPAKAGFEPAFYSLTSVEVTKPDTLQLKIPDGTAPSWYDTYLPSKETVIVPEGTDFQRPVGAGPFNVVKFAPEQQLVLEKNPEYWNADAIKLGGIELINTQSGTAATANAIRAGQVDWVYLDYSQIDAAGAEKEISTDPGDDLLVLFHVCKSQPPFDDPLVRQALSYAIDREAINQAIFGGEGEAATGLFPKDDPLHNAELDGQYEYDPDKARELLEEAGMADGFTFDMIPIEAGNVPEIVQVVQQQWAQIGVTMNIATNPNFVQDFWIDERAPMGAVPIVAGDARGRLDYYNGDEIANTCDYNDPELAKLANQLDGLSNTSDEAKQTWDQAQQIIVEDALGIMVMFRPEVYAYDGTKLGGVTAADYSIPVPDIWELFVKA